jgi:16S rRNA (adenine1518-N6/adenine1519-N6)-dimethyltransferase
MPPIRQTQSFLQGLFAERGIAPHRRLGQNFLVDLNIHDLIMRAAAICVSDVVLEVGSGTGALTGLLAGRGATVIAVEIDSALAALTGEVVAGMSGVRVLNVDILRHKNELNPLVLDNVFSALAAGSARQLKLVANLPYQVATPVITSLLVHGQLAPSLLVVTIQRELAERMTASPATPAYGAVSVVISALADISIVRMLPPSVFWPRPKVESALVVIRPSVVKRTAVGNVVFFHGLVRRVFLHRRKYLRHVLAGIWRDQWTKSDIDSWLDALGLSGQLRAEALNADEFVALAHALEERWGTIPASGRGGARRSQRSHDQA